MSKNRCIMTTGKPWLSTVWPEAKSWGSFTAERQCQGDLARLDEIGRFEYRTHHHTTSEHGSAVLVRQNASGIMDRRAAGDILMHKHLILMILIRICTYSFGITLLGTTNVRTCISKYTCEWK